MRPVVERVTEILNTGVSRLDRRQVIRWASLGFFAGTGIGLTIYVSPALAIVPILWMVVIILPADFVDNEDEILRDMTKSLLTGIIGGVIAGGVLGDKSLVWFAGVVITTMPLLAISHSVLEWHFGEG